MKLKDLLEQYGEYEIYTDSPKHIEDAFKNLDSKDDGVLSLFIKKPKSKTVWDLEKGDEYFLACYDGLTYTCDPCKWDNTSYEKAQRETGILFLTKEEAEQDLERRKVETLLLKHGGRRWFKKDGANWALYLDKHNQATRFLAEEPHQGMIYFDKHGEAVKACEEIGNKRIVNALFEVR